MLPFFRHVALLLPWVAGTLVDEGRGNRNGNRIQMAVCSMEKAPRDESALLYFRYRKYIGWGARGQTLICIKWRAPTIRLHM